MDGELKDHPAQAKNKIDWGTIQRESLLIPNLLTFGRILLIVPIVALYGREDHRSFLPLVILLIVAYLSDYADGWIARKFNQQSVLGKVLDPIADKLWTTVLLILLCLYRDFPIWIAIILITRDLTVLVINGIYMARLKYVMKTDEVSRKYQVVIGLMIILVTFKIEQATYIGYLLLGMAAITIVRYYMIYRSSVVALSELARTKVQETSKV